MHLLFTLCIQIVLSINSTKVNTSKEKVVINIEQKLDDKFVDFKYMMTVTSLIEKHLQVNRLIEDNIKTGNIEDAYDILSGIYIELISKNATSTKEKAFFKTITDFYFSKEKEKWKQGYSVFLGFCSQNNLTKKHKTTKEVSSLLNLFNIAMEVYMSRSIKFSILKCINKYNNEKFILKFRPKEDKDDVEEELNAYKMGVRPYFDLGEDNLDGVVAKNISSIYQLETLSANNLKDNKLVIESNITQTFMCEMANNMFHARLLIPSWTLSNIEKTIYTEAQNFIKRVYTQCHAKKQEENNLKALCLHGKKIIFANDTCVSDHKLYEFLLESNANDKIRVQSMMSFIDKILNLINFVTFYAICDIMTGKNTRFHQFVLSITTCNLDVFTRISHDLYYTIHVDDIDHFMKQQIAQSLVLPALKKDLENLKHPDSYETQEQKLYMLSTKRINIF